MDSLSVEGHPVNWPPFAVDKRRKISHWWSVWEEKKKKTLVLCFVTVLARFLFIVSRGPAHLCVCIAQPTSPLYTWRFFLSFFIYYSGIFLFLKSLLSPRTQTVSLFLLARTFSSTDERDRPFLFIRLRIR